ncbi:MAG: Aspartokinase (EC [uncultured Campylobacterales bacterium]|uniref:Aspartokinase n=1 Tax=uncultured Campylobacterales bacterium TaxID=352960 RepID=A0A6S6TC82_9BACT|nr:MAG: Aspartokinase (EC [uncultured Campylobacterales bacterium]
MLVVQKYGGTSVGNVEKIKNVAKRVSSNLRNGDKVVVVVSAMGGETDKLVGYAGEISKTPPKREMDVLLSSGERVTSSLLAMALESMGHEAISLTGRQAGIKTNNVHTTARIESIDTQVLKKNLNENKVIIVAGFQGITENNEVSTLGRGGSDLSAVAIAGAINADVCEIYTDVDGIYTTDPRIEPKARKLEKISYDEMLEFASMGAKVLQNRSVELAKKMNVKLVTRSSFNNNEGTLIVKEEEIMEEALVSGIALDKNQARVTLIGISDKPGIAAQIFERLSEENLNVDMIIQNVGIYGEANLSFTIAQNELEHAKRIMDELHPAKNIEFDDSIVKVSVIGVGMKSHSGVASSAFSALAKDGINIQMISTSEIKVSMVIEAKYGELAVRTLHKVYNLQD